MKKIKKTSMTVCNKVLTWLGIDINTTNPSRVIVRKNPTIPLVEKQSRVYCACCQQAVPQEQIVTLDAYEDGIKCGAECRNCSVQEIFFDDGESIILIGKDKAMEIKTGDQAADEMFAALGITDCIDGIWSSFQRVVGSVAYHFVENPVAEFHEGIAIDTATGMVAKLLDFDMNLAEEWHYPYSEVYISNPSSCDEDCDVPF